VQGVVTIETDDGTRCWKVLETLGEGGYGIVTRGLKSDDNNDDGKGDDDGKDGNDSDREVALKFARRTPKFLDFSEYYEKAIVREVEVLKKIQHENIVRMIEYHHHANFPEPNGSTTDSALLVLEYASKGTLREFIHRTGHFNDILARTYFAQIVSGLATLHAFHIAHRDLKPDNMLIDKDYTLKLAEFGFSKEYYDAEKKTDIVDTYADYGFVCDQSLGGSYRYRSPEINKAENDPTLTYCGNQCDIFALGVTLFNVRVPASRDVSAHKHGATGAFPFEMAEEKDDLWRLLSTAITKKAEGKYEEAALFWKRHKQEDFANSRVENLLFAMMHPDPLKKRANMFEVRQHKWLTKGKVYSKAELKEQMEQRWITLCTHRRTRQRKRAQRRRDAQKDQTEDAEKKSEKRMAPFRKRESRRAFEKK